MPASTSSATTMTSALLMSRLPLLAKPLFNAEYPSTATPAYCGTVYNDVEMKTLQYNSEQVTYTNLVDVCS